MLRKKQGLHAKEVATQAGLLPTAFSKIENGKQILGLQEAAQIAKVLGISVQDILQKAEEMDLIN